MIRARETLRASDVEDFASNYGRPVVAGQRRLARDYVHLSLIDPLRIFATRSFAAGLPAHQKSL